MTGIIINNYLHDMKYFFVEAEGHSNFQISARFVEAESTLLCSKQ
jgi:hypothetical protein